MAISIAQKFDGLLLRDLSDIYDKLDPTATLK
jgi:hypothetical protein